MRARERQKLLFVPDFNLVSDALSLWSVELSWSFAALRGLMYRAWWNDRFDYIYTTVVLMPRFFLIRSTLLETTS